MEEKMEDYTEKTYEILLKEYAEAGQITRHYEQLTRTSLSLFLPLFTVLTGYLFGSSIHTAAKLSLSVVGLVITLLLLNTVLRLQRYYKCYIDRAKEIERLLVVASAQVMRLYCNGAEVRHAPLTISNKTTIALVLGLAAAYFAISALLYGYHFACQAGL
jgi:putative effector of murein hydrolase